MCKKSLLNDIKNIKEIIVQTWAVIQVNNFIFNLKDQQKGPRGKIWSRKFDSL